MWASSVTSPSSSSANQTVDTKLLVYTKSYNLLTISSILVLSLLLFVVYFWLADSISYFQIYKLGRELIQSPQLYLVALATVGVSVLVDGITLNLQREFRTPLSVLFHSLDANKKYTREERDELFTKIISKVS